MPRRLVVCLVLVSACAAAPRVTQRQLFARSISQVITAAPLAPGQRVWLTNAWDSECHLGPNEGTRLTPRSSRLDAFAYEVFANVITEQRWGGLLEAHRHNYATELKPETHVATTQTSTRDGQSTTVSLTAEDLCLLDEAKKRRADKVLLYQLLDDEGDGRWVQVHFRLSDAKTGVVELSKSLFVTNDVVKDLNGGGSK